MPSLSLLNPLVDYWRQLPQGMRDGIISGLVVALIIGVAVVFRNSLILLARRLLTKSNASTLPPAQQPPHEITIKLDGLQPIPTAVELPAATITTPVPKIPRPPVAGFVARRDSEGHDILSRLSEELSPGKDQLIVLWGAGGVGKTTLAAEAARSLKQAFAGHIVWISAEGRSDFTLSTLLDEIATYLGRSDLRQLGLATKDEQVHDALAMVPTTLIVLDNFETVDLKEQDPCAEWLAKRAFCPVLITSRDEVVHARPIHILAMSLSEAREFLQHLLIQAHNPRAFEGLDRERIIQAGDRIPLVLQWVVKQIDSAKQPQAVLDDLAHGEGDAAKRVFDRSFDLPQVGDGGRAVLLALSLFVPSASREALAEVAGFGNDSERLDKAVQQLAELSLIQTSEGNERLSVEGLTRELAKTRLSRDDHFEQFARRFVIYFRRYAEAHSAPTPEDFEALELVKENILSAMDVSSKIGDWASVVYTRSALEEFLDLHGYWEDAIRSGEQALGAARELTSASSVAHFAHNLGVVLQKRGELDEARLLYNESLEIQKSLDDQGGIANSLHQLARLAQSQGELDEARRLYHESQEINKTLGNQSGIAITLHNLATIAQDQGELDEARRLYQESLEIKKRLGNQGGIASTLHQLAMLAQERGELEEALRLYNESLEIERKLGNQMGLAASLHQLGGLAQAQGDLEEARRLYNESLHIEKRLGNQPGIALTLGQLGRLAEDEGNNAEAAQLFDEALAIFEKLKSPYAKTVRQSLARVKRKSS